MGNFIVSERTPAMMPFSSGRLPPAMGIWSKLRETALAGISPDFGPARVIHSRMEKSLVESSRTCLVQFRCIGGIEPDRDSDLPGNPFELAKESV